ncbi:MAG: cell division regulator GpsB [Bacillaceae bacterium]|uniref:cell division regulator GpsB n=1 Tax=Bacillus safensis TaxID=561879 RepID=UPI000D027C30|nr:cell division regulator GpsB [Bacillus safensis]MBW4849962.1 cell division regulator GpsB [Bacillaceae bacterium]MBW4852572.1 cell division regulator GpsB [Bacillaceae bacterium]MBW4856812.1 cell division regulator GpsB [Bacillaceae bacterium]PRS23913.1 cell division regulator GpsB [Bacillus safensis]
MLADKVKLSAKEILEKEFKTGVRGYKQEEVDKFLDMVIKDYETFNQEIEKLQQENLHLSKQLEEAVEQGKRQPAHSNTTNFDILKRLSNLEKHVFGSKLYD